jgi:hypothetical protein
MKNAKKNCFSAFLILMTLCQKSTPVSLKLAAYYTLRLPLSFSAFIFLRTCDLPINICHSKFHFLSKLSILVCNSSHATSPLYHIIQLIEIIH